MLNGSESSVNEADFVLSRPWTHSYLKESSFVFVFLKFLVRDFTSVSHYAEVIE